MSLSETARGALAALPVEIRAEIANELRGPEAALRCVAEWTNNGGAIRYVNTEADELTSIIKALGDAT